MNKSAIYTARMIACVFCIFCSHLEAKPIIKGNLTGQLGNQLFTMAATISLALDNDAEPVFPDLVSNTEWGIPSHREKIFSKLNSTLPDHISIQSHYQEPYFHYAPIPYHPNMELSGYFQSEKYFKHHKDEIIELFSPSAEIKEYLTKTYPEIINHPCSVAIHVRYYFEDPNQNVYIACSSDYLKKAMALYPKDSLFVVFTNSPEWCKKVVGDISKELHFIENEPDYHDFYLMSMCKHNITCNSSFSWWAAYLNKNPEKLVIAPSAWFSPAYPLNTKDLIPSSWTIL